MTQRQQFESLYIAKHFCEALRLEEMQYRDALKWMQDEWLGNKYKDPEIEQEWRMYQQEINKNDLCNDIYSGIHY